MSKSDKLTYLALGGAGEIGMNMYLYGYGPVGKQRFLLVDTGVTFPDMDGTPGVDLITADPAFIAERADRLDGIVITHAHEDHVGGIGLLIDRLNAPVYARRFTAEIARQKLEKMDHDTSVVREVEPWPATTDIGPFTVGFVPMSHSIPEASALVIDTPQGRIFHTGDFKLDPTPLVGEAFDPDMMRQIGAEGVRVCVCDSTNVHSPHPGRSEADIVGNIRELMKSAKGLVVATTFASNIARLKTLAQAAHDEGLSITVMGRAMSTMIRNGFATGVLEDFPPIVDPKEADAIPRENLFILSTGSQGERRAASAQLAGGGFHGFSLKAGDTFLFSSKTIPGNEVSVGRILNQLSEIGVTVLDDSSGLYHVSGHANRPDLVEVHNLLKPDCIIPMHGEHRHLREHSNLAASLGIHAVIAPNGSIVDLSLPKPEVIDHVETGRLYLDGKVMIGAMDGIVRERMRMAIRGQVTVSLLMEEDGTLMDDVWVDCLGLPSPADAPGGLSKFLEEEIEQALMQASRKVLADDDGVERVVQKAVNTSTQSAIGKKPVTTVLINRFET